MYIILVYDISQDEGGKKVLPKIFKICKKYLVHIQNSVFEGEITEAQVIKLKHELNQHVRKELDSVIVFQSRHEKWLKKDFWGNEIDLTSNFI